MNLSTSSACSLADVSVTGEHLLNRYTSLLLLDAFHRMEVFRKSGETFTKAELKEKLQIINTYDRLFDALIEILDRSGFIEVQDGRIRATGQVNRFEILEEIQLLKHKKGEALTEDSTVRDFIEGNLRLVDVCLEAYPAILTGHKNYFDVMFPQGNMALVSNIYKSSIQQYLNGVVAETVRGLVAEKAARQPSEKVQVLEVGAGTGGTTGPILEKLDSLRKHLTYWYTDLAAGFTRVGRREFGSKYTFLEFKALDISKDPRTQQFPESGFDVVVCNNVLHATADTKETLGHIRTLLKTGGQVVINDLTKRLDFNTVTFGLTKDWWNFRDVENRLLHSPVLTYTLWQNILQKTGYTNVTVAGIPDLSPEDFHQSIVTATKH